MNDFQLEQLKKAKECAISKNGICLSVDYINTNHKMEWKCSKDEHPSWFSSYKSVVKNNHWCRKCADEQLSVDRRNKNGLISAQEYAKSKGGECLSVEYISGRDKLVWKCEKNHEWLANSEQVVRLKTWCPKCGYEKNANAKRNKNGLNLAKEYAKAKGGECLSNEYKNSSNKMIWKCSNKKHNTWDASYAEVVNNNTWCPQCKGKRISEALLNKDGLKIAQEYAESKGGKCVSNEYLGANSKLEWKCANNYHKSWFANYDSVVRAKSWCPECSLYYYKEHKIRGLLEYLLDTKFKKVRPKWNINPVTKRTLELDGYCEKLKIAFEFQGEHHYKENVFGNTEEDLKYIKIKDEAKKQNCINNNVKLVVIDEINCIDFNHTILILLKALSDSKIIVPKKLDYEYMKNIYDTMTNQQELFLKQAKEYAKTKGGECLSENYINAKNKLEWKCANSNHESWFAKYNEIVNKKRWCPRCANENTAIKLKLNSGLEKCKEYAKTKGGECLSSNYINYFDKLEWKCSNPEHPSWFSNYSSVVRGKSWCPYCAGNKAKDSNLEWAINYAKEHNGKCLSTIYKNQYEPLEWKCSEITHPSWFNNQKNMKANKTWCPLCKKKK